MWFWMISRPELCWKSRVDDLRGCSSDPDRSLLGRNRGGGGEGGSGTSGSGFYPVRIIGVDCAGGGRGDPVPFPAGRSVGDASADLRSGVSCRVLQLPDAELDASDDAAGERRGWLGNCAECDDRSVSDGDGPVRRGADTDASDRDRSGADRNPAVQPQAEGNGTGGIVSLACSGVCRVCRVRTGAVFCQSSLLLERVHDEQ